MDRDSKIHNSILFTRTHNILIPRGTCIMNERSIYLVHVNGTIRSGVLSNRTRVVLSNRKRRANYVRPSALRCVERRGATRIRGIYVSLGRLHVILNAALNALLRSLYYIYHNPSYIYIYTYVSRANWRRALSLHLWPLTSPLRSITELCTDIKATEIICIAFRSNRVKSVVSIVIIGTTWPQARSAKALVQPLARETTEPALTRDANKISPGLNSITTPRQAVVCRGSSLVAQITSDLGWARRRASHRKHSTEDEDARGSVPADSVAAVNKNIPRPCSQLDFNARWY